MTTQSDSSGDVRQTLVNNPRAQLLAELPVKERRFLLDGISTAVLEGGDGPPIILLHGPGESVVWWMRVIPDLVTTHHVIVPDLPGHGASVVSNGALDAERVFAWLGELIEQTCTKPPVLVGHLLGGAIAARFAIIHGDRLSQLVLVDALGLGRFRPKLRFAFELIRFMMRPTERSYDRFLPQCMYDADALREGMGERWEPFLAYQLERASDPDAKTALRPLMSQVGVPKIPSEDLERINVPTCLIWGRHDRANDLKIAEEASKRYGWPLHVVENAGDDPKLEQPEAFLRALYTALGTTTDVYTSRQSRITR